MDKYKSAIAEYEESRQQVQGLSKERNELILRCASLNDLGVGQICLVTASDALKQYRRESGEYSSYTEILHEVAEAANYKTCVQSYALKMGALARARARYGIAKRRISQMGKPLIKHTEG